MIALIGILSPGSKLQTDVIAWAPAYGAAVYMGPWRMLGTSALS